MTNWMVRGLAFAAAMVVVRLFQGALINAWPTQATLISVVLVLLFIIGVVAWGVIDGRADATAHPDPDRRGDLAMTWLLAGLVAGVVSGAVSWLISLFYQRIYTAGLLNEVTTFAAFTALAVFLPAIAGVAVGRWRVDRSGPPVPQHGPGSEQERVDTDVFAAARAADSPTGEMAEPEERTAAVATAERESDTITAAEREAPTETIPTFERDAPTETIPTGEREGATETIRTTDDDAKTEVIRTDPRHAKPSSEPEKD
jgi:hypothetical protein